MTDITVDLKNIQSGVMAADSKLVYQKTIGALIRILCTDSVHADEVLLVVVRDRLPLELKCRGD